MTTHSRLHERLLRTTLADAEPGCELPPTVLRDKHGRPRRFYHGTTAAFDEFSADYAGTATSAKNVGLGFFFSDNPNVASVFASGEGGRVIPVYLDIQNPIEAERRWDLCVPEEQVLPGFRGEKKRMKTYRRDAIDPYEVIKNAITQATARIRPEVTRYDEVTEDDVQYWKKLVQQLGYDGVGIIGTATDSLGGATARSLHNPYHDFYIAFRAEQIIPAYAPHLRVLEAQQVRERRPTQSR